VSDSYDSVTYRVVSCSRNAFQCRERDREPREAKRILKPRRQNLIALRYPSSGEVVPCGRCAVGVYLARTPNRSEPPDLPMGRNSNAVQLTDLSLFIISAKQATYVGDGAELLSYRLGSHDLQFRSGDWVYHDSYLGESDFIGQEVVYHHARVVWGMNYLGYILEPTHHISGGRSSHQERPDKAVRRESVSGPVSSQRRRIGVHRHERGRCVLLHWSRVD